MIDFILENYFTVRFLILISLCFFGSFIDAIAGGGGLITLPAFLLSGLDPAIAMGTNKLVNTFSSIGSSLNYAKSDKINWKMIKFLAPLSFIGSSLGVITIINIKNEYIYPLVFIALIIVIIYTSIDKKAGSSNMFEGLNSKNLFLGSIMALGIGFYNGFLGPGTGSFLVFAIIKIFKYDFVNANGNSKILNLVGNLTSLIIFIYSGRVNYVYGLPICIVMVIAAQIGAKFAIHKGSKFIRIIFLIVSYATAFSILNKFLNIF